MGIEAWIRGSIQIPLLPYRVWVLAAESVLLFLAALLTLPLARRASAARWRVWAVLLAFTPLAAAVLILRLPPIGLSSLPGVPLSVPPVAAGLLAFVPILLSAGLAGPTPTLLIGLALGITRAVLDTHQLTTVAEYGLIAWWIAFLMRNEYGGGFFSWLRRPWGAASLALPLGVLLRAAGDWSLAHGDLLTTLDFVTSRVPAHALGLGLELLAAAGVCELIRVGLPSLWPAPARLTITRFQRSLVWHLSLWVTMPLTLMAGIILAAVIIQTRAQARSALLAQARLAAGHAAQTLPAAIMTGQTLLEDMASDVARLAGQPDNLAAYFADRLRQPPYFQQLAFLPQVNRVAASVPALGDPFCASLLEAEGCSAAFAGTPWIGWVDISGSENPWLEMAHPVSDGGRTLGILVGRTSLEINPLLAPVQASLSALPDAYGLLLDREDIVLFPASAEPWSEDQPAGVDELGGSWYFGTTSDGRRRISYVMPLSYPDWKVALRVPEAAAFNTSLQAGLNIGLLTLLVTLVTQMLVVVIAQRITRPLRQLVHAANALAAGDLDRRVETAGEDEFAALGRAFEVMRRNLQRQLRDQDLLLQASQGVATHLELLPACLPILQSALASSAAQGARIVLGDGHATTDGPIELAAGELSASMAPLDGYVLAHVRDRSPWLVADLTKASDYFPASLEGRMGALIALRLSHGEVLYGALWLAFRDPQVFEAGMVDLLTGLAGQASLAVTNAGLLDATESERQRLATILAAIPDGVVMTDAEGRVLFFNAAARTLLGAALPEVGGRVTAGGQGAGLAQALADSGGEGQTMEFVAPGGRRLLATARTIAGARSISLGRVCLLQDVTRFRKLEDLKTEFVNTVSHDLRRPLTLVDGHVNMLEMLGPLNPAQKEYVGRIRDGVRGMARLVSDLLDLGRIEKGIEAHASAIDVRATLEKVVEDYRPEAAGRSIRLEIELPDRIPALTADGSLLERALGNLLDNAIRFNRHGGSVHLRVAAHEEQVVFSVEDSGVGIAPADMPRLFERFYQVNRPELGDARGWGLGLAIVRSVAEAHHGRAWCESQLGKGSTFFLALPAHP
jgi:two-component system, OmpR family, phosphate regulon sensor histidine kinase PhoR